MVHIIARAVITFCALMLAAYYIKLARHGGVNDTSANLALALILVTTIATLGL